MQLYNSASHRKEEFVPHVPGKVSMYTCGPTVYHFAHIGNLRTYMMEDVLEKYLRYAGYDVTRVMNITDVGHLSSDADEGEDKMLKGARREKKTVMEIAKYYTDAFFADCAKLNIKTPDVVQPATGCIDEYIHRYPPVGDDFQVHLVEVALPSAGLVIGLLERGGGFQLALDVADDGLAVGQDVSRTEYILKAALVEVLQGGFGVFLEIVAYEVFGRWLGMTASNR